MAVPMSVAECDKALEQERLLLVGSLHDSSKVAIWDRIDALLERRIYLRRVEARRARGITSRRSNLPGIGHTT